MGVDSVESQQVEKESYFYVPLEWSMVISRLAKHYFSPLKSSHQGVKISRKLKIPKNSKNSLHTFFFNLPLLKGMIERLFNFAQINLKANNIIS